MNVFLSRDKPSELLQKKADLSGWSLICFSCIEFSLINEIKPPETEWIFFYSPSAVKLFANNFNVRSFRFAALGEGTADTMRNFGIQPEFIGKSSDTSKAIEEFSGVIKPTENVVQARGERSFERLREKLPPSQILDWPFYRTRAKQELTEATADYYIFTSPSNAEAYLGKFDLPVNAVVLVFGESTKAAVEKYSTAEVYVTTLPGEEGALRIMKKLS